MEKKIITYSLITENDEKTPDEVDKTCDLLLEFFDINNISLSIALSAMATLLASNLASFKKEDPFHRVMEMMQTAFKEQRKINGM